MCSMLQGNWQTEDWISVPLSTLTWSQGCRALCHWFKSLRRNWSLYYHRAFYHRDTGAFFLMNETTLRAHTPANRNLVWRWNPIPLLLVAHEGEVHPPECDGHFVHAVTFVGCHREGRRPAQWKNKGGGWVGLVSAAGGNTASSMKSEPVEMAALSLNPALLFCWLGGL